MRLGLRARLAARMIASCWRNDATAMQCLNENSQQTHTHKCIHTPTIVEVSQHNLPSSGVSAFLFWAFCRAQTKINEHCCFILFYHFFFLYAETIDKPCDTLFGRDAWMGSMRLVSDGSPAASATWAFFESSKEHKVKITIKGWKRIKLISLQTKPIAYFPPPTLFPSSPLSLQLDWFFPDGHMLFLRDAPSVVLTYPWHLSSPCWSGSTCAWREHKFHQHAQANYAPYSSASQLLVTDARARGV